MPTLHNKKNSRRTLEYTRNSNEQQRQLNIDVQKRNYNSAIPNYETRTIAQPLKLEDIEHSPIQHCRSPVQQRNRQSFRGSLSAPHQSRCGAHVATHSPISAPQPRDLLARGDFTAYQGTSLHDFFNETSPPRSVSQICLVNDHFILVKMPETHWRRNLPLERVIEERSAMFEAKRKATLENQTRKNQFERRENLFLRYLPCQRSRRVSPVQEMSEEDECETQPTTRRASKSLISSCWRASKETEVFESHTILRGVLSTQKSIVTKVITIQPNKTPTMPTTEKPLDLRVKHVHIEESPPRVANQELEHQQTDEHIFGSRTSSPARIVEPMTHTALQTSVHNDVQLEPHGVWHSDAEVSSCRLQSAPGTSKKPKSAHSLNAFKWLFKRTKTSKKSKSKIQAVVYKTYFVHWKKPPEELCQPCGNTSKDCLTDSTETFKWKRCHSARF